MQTCRKIVSWRQYLRFPEEVAVGAMARDLVCRLLCDVDDRIGTHGGAAEIKVRSATAACAARAPRAFSAARACAAQAPGCAPPPEPVQLSPPGALRRAGQRQLGGMHGF